MELQAAVQETLAMDVKYRLSKGSVSHWCCNEVLCMGKSVAYWSFAVEPLHRLSAPSHSLQQWAFRPGMYFGGGGQWLRSLYTTWISEKRKNQTLPKQESVRLNCKSSGLVSALWMQLRVVSFLKNSIKYISWWITDVKLCQDVINLMPSVKWVFFSKFEDKLVISTQ